VVPKTATNIPQPGIKLLKFFKAAVAGVGNIEFSTSKAQALSESMKLLNPLSGEEAKKWMQYWREKEFIP
jgi:hypothetical protein